MRRHQNFLSPPVSRSGARSWSRLPRHGQPTSLSDAALKHRLEDVTRAWTAVLQASCLRALARRCMQTANSGSPDPGSATRADTSCTAMQARAHTQQAHHERSRGELDVHPARVATLRAGMRASWSSIGMPLDATPRRQGSNTRMPLHPPESCVCRSGNACDGIARPQRCRRGARRWREPWDTRRLLGVLPRSHQTTSGDVIEPVASPPPRAPSRLSVVPRSLFDLSSPPTLAPNGRTSPRAVPLDVVQRAGPWACLGRAAPRGLPVPAELAASRRRRCGCVSFLTISEEPWQQRHGCLSSACAASAMSVSSLRC